MKIVVRLLFVVSIAMLAACQPPSAQPAAPTVTPTIASAVVPSAAVAETLTLPLSTATVATPTELPTTAPTVEGALQGLPAPTLFNVAWEDRSLFRSGLISGEQTVLDAPSGESVYHIDLRIADDQTSVQGKQEVLYTNREAAPLAEVVFRLFPNLTGGSMAVSDLTVNGQPAEARYEQRDSAMIVSLPEPLAPGQQTVFAMDFDVTVPTDESSNYGTFAYLRDVLALAHFYPMIAVYDHQGWNDEIAPQEGDIIYNDASLYLVRVNAQEELAIVSSGVTLDRQEENGRQVLTAAAGPARDFYLAASDGYEVASQKVGETTIHSYAPATLQSGAREVLETAGRALQDFEARFGPYPYTELDLVSTGTNALGVEYPGIIAITDRAYEGDYGRFLESTVVHEVAHQWFYNEVGNDQIDEPWLDEALAQYATLLYFQDEYGVAGADGYRQALEDRWNRANRVEIPIGMPVAKYTNGSYGAIVYGRGPLFFDALREKMGDETFDAFLRDYVQANRWGIATTEGLRALAEQRCGCDLGSLFRKWVYSE